MVCEQYAILSDFPVVDAHYDSTLVVDCAEGTVRQFAINATRIKQSGERAWKIGKVTKIFITHMHGALLTIILKLCC